MGYLLITPEQKTVLDALNAAQSDMNRQITPRTLADGRLVVSDSLLEDVGTTETFTKWDGTVVETYTPGTWDAYADLLRSLSSVEVADSDWPQLPTYGDTPPIGEEA